MDIEIDMDTYMDIDINIDMDIDMDTDIKSLESVNVLSGNSFSSSTLSYAVPEN